MELMTNVFESVLWILFLNLFCPARKGKFMVWMGSVLAILLLLVNVSVADRVEVYSQYTFLSDFLITFLFAQIFLKGAWYWKAFLILLYNIALMGSNFLCVNFLIGIFRVEADEMVSADGSLRIALIAGSKGLLLFLFFAAYKCRNRLYKLQQMGIRLLLLPILANEMILVLIQIFARFYRNTSDVVWIIWLIVLISLSFVVCFRLAYDAYRGREEKKISELLRAQAAIQKEAYEQQYQNVRQVRKHQHDIKHRLVVIEQMLIQGEYDKAQAYTRDYLTELENINVFKYGDSIMSTLLLLKEERARKNGIQWQVDMQVCHVKRMSEMDLCVVLGNLLDNAIEAERAVKTDPEIRVYVCEKQLLYICVENISEEKTGKGFLEGASSKQNAGLHGFGIPRIRELVEKYHGELEITNKEGWFRAEIYI